MYLKLMNRKEVMVGYNTSKKPLLRSSNLLIAAVIVLAIFFGLATAVLSTMFNNPLKLVALPILIVLIFMFFYNRSNLILAVILARASLDPLLNWSGVGLGGALNILVISICILFLLSSNDVDRRPFLRMWSPFLLIAMISVFYSPDKIYSLRFFLLLLSYCALFIIPFYLVKSTKDAGIIVRLLVMSSLIPICYALFELGTGRSMTVDGIRLKSTFTHANVFAFYLVVMITFSLYLLKTKVFILPKVKRLLLVLYMLLMVALLVFTKTRGAWLACLQVFVFYGLFFERKLLVYLFVAGVSALFVPAVQERLADLVQVSEYAQYAQYTKLNSYEWRVQLWLSSLEWVKLKPILGYGINTFQLYSTSFFPLERVRGFDAHSVYFQFLFDIGLVGLLAFLFLLFNLFAWLKRLYPQDKTGIAIITALAIAYMIASYSDNIMHYHALNWYFWALMGFVCAYMQVLKRQATQSVGDKDVVKQANKTPR